MITRSNGPIVLRILLLFVLLLGAACKPTLTPTDLPASTEEPREEPTVEPTEEPTEEAPMAVATVPEGETPDTTVAIFVIDKFMASAQPIDAANVEEEIPYPVGEGCVIDPDGSGYKSRGGGDSEHGPLVWSTITESLVQAYGANLVDGKIDADLWALLASPADVAMITAAGDLATLSQRWQLPGQGYIRLIPVDIGDFDTATVSNGITNALDSLGQYPEAIDGVVLNMSWVVLPKGACELPANADAYRDQVCDILTADDVAREKYLEDTKATLDALGLPTGSLDEICGNNFFTFNGIKDITNAFLLSKQFSELIPEEYLGIGDQEPTGPLGLLLARCALGECAGRQVISIGAAGNSGWAFPMMPALWDSVVSTSAVEGLGQDPADCDTHSLFCSNGAEISLSGTHPYEGELVASTAPDCVPGFTCALYTNEVKGSSYAAPRLSVFAAQYLLAGGTNPCEDQPNIHPPLGYMTETASATVLGAWQNLDVATASAQFCQAFLQ